VLGGRSEEVMILTIQMQADREAAMKILLAKQTAKSKHPSQPTHRQVAQADPFKIKTAAPGRQSSCSLARCARVKR